MGDLPSSKLCINSPFSIAGNDYAGLFFIKNHYGQRSKVSKC